MDRGYDGGYAQKRRLDEGARPQYSQYSHDGGAKRSSSSAYSGSRPPHGGGFNDGRSQIDGRGGGARGYAPPPSGGGKGGGKGYGGGGGYGGGRGGPLPMRGGPPSSSRPSQDPPGVSHRGFDPEVCFRSLGHFDTLHVDHALSFDPLLDTAERVARWLSSTSRKLPRSRNLRMQGAETSSEEGDMAKMVEREGRNDCAWTVAALDPFMEVSHWRDLISLSLIRMPLVTAAAINPLGGLYAPRAPTPSA